MPKREATGSCLCQKVSYKITNNLGILQYCHCSRCRKFTGSAHASNLLVNPKDFEWLSGEEYVGHFRIPGARNFATAFCKNCGSSLPWLEQTGKIMVVPAGTLDEDPVTRPVWNVYCDSKATWYRNPAELMDYQQLPGKSQNG